MIMIHAMEIQKKKKKKQMNTTRAAEIKNAILHLAAQRGFDMHWLGSAGSNAKPYNPP